MDVGQPKQSNYNNPNALRELVAKKFSSKKDEVGADESSVITESHESEQDLDAAAEVDESEPDEGNFGQETEGIDSDGKEQVIDETFERVSDVEIAVTEGIDSDGKEQDIDETFERVSDVEIAAENVDAAIEASVEKLALNTEADADESSEESVLTECESHKSAQCIDVAAEIEEDSAEVVQETAGVVLEDQVSLGEEEVASEITDEEVDGDSEHDSGTDHSESLYSDDDSGPMVNEDVNSLVNGDVNNLGLVNGHVEAYEGEGIMFVAPWYKRIVTRKRNLLNKMN